MICVAFGVVTLIAVCLAASVREIKKSSLALWVAGMASGCVYVTVGAEILAVVQWIVSTLVAISFVFFSVMLSGQAIRENKRKIPLTTIFSPILGLALTLALWFGVGKTGPTSFELSPPQVGDLVTFGKAIAEDHFLSVEVIALTLFLVLIGGGVLSRPEGKDG